MFRWIALALVALGLQACSKETGSPTVFLPNFVSADGKNLDALRLENCGASRSIDLQGELITPENFQAVFKCANYDGSLNELVPLFNSRHSSDLIKHVADMMNSGESKELKKTLDGWLKDGPEGNSRADRLLPFLDSLIRNKSFQEFLPVLDNILQSGQDLWKDLLPGLADVIYTERFPDNIEDAFEIFSTFSEKQEEPKKGGELTGENENPEKKTPEKTNYAKMVKDIAQFLQSKDEEGKTASMRLLEVLHGVGDLEQALNKQPQVEGKPSASSLYAMVEHMLEKGTIHDYFMNSGRLRGEVINPILNDKADPEDEACPDLNNTAEERQQCALERMFRRGKDGSEAPLVQLAEMIAELQKDHPEFLPSLAAWFSSNGHRITTNLRSFVIGAQVVSHSTKLNVPSFFNTYLRSQGLDPKAPMTGDQFAEFVIKAFASPEFQAHLDKTVPQTNNAIYGSRNGQLLKGSPIRGEIGALYAAPELGAAAKALIPEGKTEELQKVLRVYGNKHRTGVELSFQDKKGTVEEHLKGIWLNAGNNILGEDQIFDYALKLVQTLASEMAGKFKEKGQPISEWYFTSPYGSPDFTEMLVGYGAGTLDLLSTYKKNKEWLKTEFVEEVWSDEADKRAARVLIDQVPNMILYVRSGMSRTGGDLTRALSKDTDGFIVRSYVSLIGHVVESGWLKKGVRLIDAWNSRPWKEKGVKSPAKVSDAIPDRRKYKKAVDAAQRILQALIQPEREGDYSTSTVGRLMVPLKTIVGEGKQREKSERFLLTSAQQLLDLADEKINEFVGGLDKTKPPGSVSERRETFRAVADLLRDQHFPGVVKSLAGLFQDKAIEPALEYLRREDVLGEKLPKVLRLMRRILGYTT
jgi:hypothetical protein